jgi:hypothetical protein
VLEIGMEMRWIRVRVRPMARPANPLGARSIGGSQDDEQKRA